MDKYINDYKINVVEVAWLSEEQLKLLSVMTGDERYCDILYQKIGENEEKIEVKTMCEVADRLIKKGESKGLQEGKDRERIRIIQKKLEKGMTTEQVAELMELPIEEVERLIGSI